MTETNRADTQKLLFHYSEDPTITQFVPHVPKSNPTHPPRVWAIDKEHAPLYWFPRDCPRVAAWPRDESERDRFCRVFATNAPRIHVVEWAWCERIGSAELFEYRFYSKDFTPWTEAEGQWVSSIAKEPVGVHAIGNLMERHGEATIELRFVDRLHNARDLAVQADLGFSVVRFANALAPR